jgi:hypothetical protein
MAGPASANPILVLADLSRLRVRAFVEELDVARVGIGQSAVVTADGMPGQEFTGVVTQVLPRMGKRGVETDAPGEYKDIYHREVLIDLDEGQILPVSLRVRVRINSRMSDRTPRTPPAAVAPSTTTPPQPSGPTPAKSVTTEESVRAGTEQWIPLVGWVTVARWWVADRLLPPAPGAFGGPARPATPNGVAPPPREKRP